MDVDTRHLRVLIAVVDAGGFSAAATQLHTAQSAVSRTVADLERRLGVRLLDRTTRRVTTTPEGDEIVRLARHAVDQVNRTLAHLDGYVEGTRGTVSVAALPSIAACLIPSVIAEFRRERPTVSISIVDALAEGIEVMVSEGTVDFAISSKPSTSGRLESRLIACDRFYCLCPSTHTWAGRDRVPWSALSGQDFVQFSIQSSIRAHVDRVTASHGVRLGRTTEASSVVSVAGLVAAGAGVSAVPALVGPLTRFAGATMVELTDPVATREIWIIRDPLRPLAPVPASLMDLVLEAGDRGLRLPPGCRWLS